MSFRERVDREFERRREELLDEIVRDGGRVARELHEAGRLCAHDHPLAWIGAGFAAGAVLTATNGVPRALGRAWKVARSALSVPLALPFARIGGAWVKAASTAPRAQRSA